MFGLALGKLEALARPGQTVLLALFFARVAGEEAALFQRAPQLRVVHGQRAGDPQAGGAGLAAFRQQQQVSITHRGWAIILAMATLMADPSPDCWDAVGALVRAMQLFQKNRAELLGTVATEAPLGWWDEVTYRVVYLIYQV